VIWTEWEHHKSLSWGFCQPEIPTARPRACWQRKFPQPSTCNVTLIPQRDEQKGGYWSRFHGGCLSLSDSFFSPFSFCTYQNQNLATGNRRDRVNPLNSNCPQGLTCLSKPAMDSSNNGGCHDNSSATLPHACVVRGRQRRHFPHHHQGFFSPCCWEEILLQQPFNGLIECFFFPYLIPSFQQKTLEDVLSQLESFALFMELFCHFLCSLMASFEKLSILSISPERISSFKWIWTEKEKVTSVIMAPCYPGSAEQETPTFRFKELENKTLSESGRSPSINKWKQQQLDSKLSF